MKPVKHKRLNTGVYITFDKKGNIKTLVSPYWVDEVEESYVTKTFNNLFKGFYGT